MFPWQEFLRADLSAVSTQLRDFSFYMTTTAFNFIDGWQRRTYKTATQIYKKKSEIVCDYNIQNESNKGEHNIGNFYA